MKIRALWVYYLGSSGASPRLIFSRKFPTIEKRAQLIKKDKYIPLPTNIEFTKNLFAKIRLKEKSVKCTELHSAAEDNPFYEVDTTLGHLSPVIILNKNKFLYCCLSFVDQGPHQSQFLVDIPGISLCYDLLCALSDVLHISHLQDENSLFNDINTFLIEAVPLGTIRDVNSASINVKSSNKKIVAPGCQKQPAWRTSIHKGKNQIHICVTESARAVLYSPDDKNYEFELYGSVTCKADLEGVMPEVTLNITHTSGGQKYPLDNIMVHSCVQSADTDDIILGNQDWESRANPRRIRFIPPMEQFVLCNYSVSTAEELPISGYYDMQIDITGKIIVEVRLSLSNKIKNSFDLCELRIPIYNRGLVQSYDVNASQGSVQLVEKRMLVWNIGQKFPSKNLEVFLTSSLQMNKQLPTPPDMYEDPFCVGLNSYVLLNFRISDFTQSGCHVDSKSMQVSGKSKCKLTTVHEYISFHYQLWNIRGEALNQKPKS